MLLFLPLFLYVILLAPYLQLIPANDANTEFLFSMNFYRGEYFSNWVNFHPPVKLILFSLFFKLFGFWTYNYVGFLLGIAGIIAIYFAAKKMFDEKTALISAFLLALSGLYLSVGIMGLNDYIMTVFLIIAFCFYVRSHYLLYAIAASLAFLTKEPAVLFAGSILLVELVKKRKISVYFLIPILVCAAWFLFLKLTGRHLWNDWNFSDTASKGSAYTIINNLVTFHFLNKYAYANWLHLFVFNFNWLLWIIASYSFFKFIKNKFTLIIIIFTLSYSLIVLTFQTFPITRYVLPVLPFMYIFAARTLSSIPLSKAVTAWVLLLLLLSIYRSNDPVSNVIWQTNEIWGEKLYTKELEGVDGMTYNLQYLNAVKKRDQRLQSGDCTKDITINYHPEILKILEIQCK